MRTGEAEAERREAGEARGGGRRSELARAAPWGLRDVVLSDGGESDGEWPPDQD